MLCGNRSPISGECIIGCGGFGGCKYGHDAECPRTVDYGLVFRMARTETAQKQPGPTETGMNKSGADGV